MKHLKKSIFLLGSTVLSLAATTQAAEVSTAPVGYTTWTINAGTGTDRALTTLGIPLYQPASTIDGAASGVITAATSNTLTVSGAGWTADQLADAASPYVVRITSGSAEGRNLLVSANTEDTLTIDLFSSGVTDVSALGIVTSTDTFELVECDTLLSLFGEPSAEGIDGGADASDADTLFIFVNGAWARFYFDTDTSRWSKVTFGFPDASNQVLMPDTAILFSRLADYSSEFVLTGTVPTTSRKVTINASGATPIGSALPTDISLANSGISGIPGWVFSSDTLVADIVFIFDGSWSRYYHDGSNWRKITFGTPISDDLMIASGSAVLISKSSAGTVSTLTQTLPYSL